MEAQAVAALLPVCMEILGRIAELQTRVADMAQYASAIMSVQTDLENANKNEFVVPSMIERSSEAEPFCHLLLVCIVVVVSLQRL